MDEEKNGNIEQLIQAGRKRGISEKGTRSAIKMGNPDQIVRNLRTLGYAFIEIAAYDGRSSQWMSQLAAKNSQSAAPAIKPKTDVPENIIRAILAEACHDLSWWSNDRGRMIQDKVIERFRQGGYTWKESRKHDVHTRGDKLTVILMITFGIGPTNGDRKDWVALQLEAMTKDHFSRHLESGDLYFDIRPTDNHIKAWFREQLETLTKGQIFNLINQGQPLQITERAYVRTWNKLGLHVKIRKPRMKT